MSTEDDVFSDNWPVIVDCDVLEAAKENVQPLASGRRVTTLSNILATPHAKREAKLSASRNRLRINIELTMDDEDGDLLDAYYQLVHWTIESYPQGPSAESGLIELLEEATRVLKDHRGGLWRGDLRYLKLWLLYASFVEKPTIIHKFLIANEIGTDFALLYEEYAAVLERDGRRKDADEAYALGIARRASPLDHLQTRHSEFQKRMMSNILPTPGPSVSPVHMPPRSVLAASGLAPSSGTTSSMHHDLPLASSTTRPAANARLQIFMDPTGLESSQAAETSANAWTDLGTRKTRIKENVPEVKKFAGTTLKQAGRSKRVASGSGSSSSASAAASSSKIIPYRDTAPADMAPPTVPAGKKGQDAVPRTPAKTKITPCVDDKEGAGLGAGLSTPMFTPFRDDVPSTPTDTAAPAPESVMKVKKVGMKAPVLASEAEALRKDPLKNYSKASVEDDI